MKRGFSLVELSIVLVILGLLVGGVLSGQALIHASQLRTVSSDFQKYQSAVMTFRDKYFALPGDMTNADQVWGLAGGTSAANDATCDAVVSTTTATCNGDGNGYIDGPGEFYRAWQQLANAGLIEGQYTGAQDTTGGFQPTYYTRGLNVPPSRMGNGAFAFVIHAGPPGIRYSTMTTPTPVLDITLVQPLTASGGAGPTTVPFTGVLLNEDAWNIDTKMDDGVAASGMIRADIIKASVGTNVTDMTCLTYTMSDTTDHCGLSYIFGTKP